MPFEIYQSEKTSKYHFRLKANNGQIILISQSYDSKDGAKKGVESVINNAGNDARFERKTASNGSPYFVLKAGNGQVIGQSEMYSSASGMENGIKSVRNHATRDAAVKDSTS